MKSGNKKSIDIIIFSKWSRKSYALFSTLKRLVKIAQLSVDICATSIQKLATSLNECAVQSNEFAEELTSDDKELTLFEKLIFGLTEVVAAEKNKCVYTRLLYSNNIQSPLKGNSAINGLF